MPYYLRLFIIVGLLVGYDLKPLTTRMLLGLGISAARRSANSRELKHLQLSYCNGRGLKSMIRGPGFRAKDVDNCHNSH